MIVLSKLISSLAKDWITSMSHDPKLVKYHVKCPSRHLLLSGRWFGWLTAFTGIGVLAIVAYRNVSQAGDTYSNAVRDFQNCMDHLNEYQAYVSAGPKHQGKYISEAWQPACEVPNKPWFEYVNWHYAVIMLVVGIIAASYFGSRFKKYYRRVRQGKIIKKDIESGGSMYSHWTSYLVLVEGYTYHNELYAQWRDINAGAWHDKYREGDYIDLR